MQSTLKHQLRSSSRAAKTDCWSRQPISTRHPIAEGQIFDNRGFSTQQKLICAPPKSLRPRSIKSAHFHIQQPNSATLSIHCRYKLRVKSLALMTISNGTFGSDIGQGPQSLQVVDRITFAGYLKFRRSFPGLFWTDPNLLFCCCNCLCTIGYERDTANSLMLSKVL